LVRVENLTPVFVSHHQFQVLAGDETGDYLGLYTVGDDLLQVTGGSQLTVLTGPHTGEVEVSAAVLSSAPPDDALGWDAAAEATVCCPAGRVAICGLMGDCPAPLAELTTGRPGLLRVRVSARNRRPDGHPPTPHTPEEYQVCMWPVDEDTGFRSLRADELPSAGWTPNRPHAAGWAMLRLIALANPDPREVALRRAAAAAGHAPADRPLDRVQVRRHRTVPAASARAFLHRPADHLGAAAADGDLVLPAGQVEIRLRPVATTEGFAARWRWTPRTTATAVPDEADSTVEIRVDPGPSTDAADLTVVHHAVRAVDAVLLGLIWDHLLEHVHAVASGRSVPPHPWVPMFDDLAARVAAQAAAARRSTAQFEARRWGGTPPTERLRRLPANTIGLAHLDRGLLDALGDSTPDVQRAMARWAARQACTIAGLATIDWIAPALTALERGEPLPPPFDDDHQPWDLLRADQRVPSTTVTIPTGTPNCSQQAIALPAIHAAAHDDPLAGAVDTIYFAALAYGRHHRDLLASANARLATLDPRR
jgi:hypothetical protein